MWCSPGSVLPLSTGASRKRWSLLESRRIHTNALKSKNSVWKKLWYHPRCRSRSWQVANVRALFGDLLQRFSSRSLLFQPPLDALETEATLEPLEPVLTEQALKTCNLLAICRLERPLEIPSFGGLSIWCTTPGHAAASFDQHVTPTLPAEPSCAASNAVPFPSGGMPVQDGVFKEGSHVPNGVASSPEPASGPGRSDFQLPISKAEHVHPILPGVFAAEGELDMSCIEFLAGQLALSQLQLLDFTKVQEAHARCLPSSIYLGDAMLAPSARVVAAARLHRMIIRHGGLCQELPQIGGKAILMVYTPEDCSFAAETLALYLYLYCQLSLTQAMQEAQLSMGVEVNSQALLPCLRELESFAAGWQRRAKLVWPYSGGRVEVSGEAVGGWEHKVPLAFDVQKRHWVAWLWGLEPGVYRCKFIVDGRWCIDMAAPTENDGRGNVNNIIHIREGCKSIEALDSTAKCAKGGQPEECSAAQPLEHPVGAAAVHSEGGTGGVRAASSSGILSSAGSGELTVTLGKAGPSPALLLSAAASLGGGTHSTEGTGAVVQVEDDGEGGSMVRFGAMLLALYCKLAVQHRAPSGQR